MPNDMAMQTGAFIVIMSSMTNNLRRYSIKYPPVNWNLLVLTILICLRKMGP